MEGQVIKFVKTKKVSVPYERDDAYSFREDKKFHLIQKLCFFILEKIGAKGIGEKVDYVRHVVDGDDFMRNLFEQRGDVARMFNEEPSTLFIGSEDYGKLMASEEVRNHFSFRAQYGYGEKLIGLDVKVIPWMTGMLVVPKSKRL